MSNGLDYSFYLGLCGCACLFASSTLADFSSNDSANLKYIQDDVENTYYKVNSIDYKFGDYITNVYRHHGIFNSFVQTPDGNSIYSFYSGIAQVTGSLYRLSLEIQATSNAVTSSINNFADRQTNDNYRIIASINNLTNFLGTAQTIPLQPDLMTNLLFMAAFFNSSYAGFSPLEYVAPNEINTMFSVLFGRSPTQAERNKLKTLVSYYSPQKTVFYPMFSSIDKDHALDSGQWDQHLRFYYGNNNNVINRIQDISKERYHQYATLPLLEFWKNATNDYPISGPVVTQYTDSETSETRPGFSSSFVRTVSSLSEDFTTATTLDDNISDVNTNEISQVEDSGYQSRLSSIREQSILAAGQLDGLVDAVEGIGQQAASFLPDFEKQQTLVINFGTVSLFGVSKTITFTLSQLPQVYWTMQRFFFSLIKVLCLVLVSAQLYQFISQDTEV